MYILLTFGLQEGNQLLLINVSLKASLLEEKLVDFEFL